MGLTIVFKCGGRVKDCVLWLSFAQQKCCIKDPPDIKGYLHEKMKILRRILSFNPRDKL
jgi:hypothetical protein